METTEKKRRKVGILGVQSNVKLFSMSGELWSDEDSKDSDEDFVPSPTVLAEARGNGNRVPKNGEDADAIITSESSDTEEDSDIPSKPVRKVPSLKIKVPQANVASDAPIVKAKRQYKKRRSGRPASANGKGSPRKRSKKEPYYDPETQELQAEAASEVIEPDVFATWDRNLKPLLQPNQDHENVSFVLPNEILVKIFKMITDENPKQTIQILTRFSSVCETWRCAILKAPELWQTLDLSEINYRGFEEHLTRLCTETTALSSVVSLNLSGWPSITEDHLNMFTNLFGSKLKSINLRDCHNISQSLLGILQLRCPNLESIDLSRTSYTNANPAPHGSRNKGDKQLSSNPLNPTSFKSYLSAVGEKITGLNLAENKLQSYYGIIGAILDNCPNLTVLDLSNLDSSSSTGVLSVDKLQTSCPNLKVLRLASMTLQASNRGGTGFPFLEELVIPVQGEAHSVGHSDNILGALTDKAENLKMLDIRGSRSLTVSSLIKIPSWNVEHLSLAYCTKLHCTDLGELALGKWKDSLIDFDLSWNVKGDSVSASLETLAESDNSQLRTLLLRGSAVSMKSVSRLIKNCKRMVSIDLQSCRGLPRGIKRVFEGKDFRKFAEDIRNGHYDYYE